MMRRSWSLGLVALLAGCSLLGPGTQDVTRAYVLRPVAAPAVAAPAVPELGVGPVEVAGYLDRPELLRAAADGRVDRLDFDHWAEPLAGAVSRVVAENLAQRLGRPLLHAYPWPPSVAPVWQLRLHLLRCEGDGADALVRLGWELRRTADRQRLAAGVEEVRVPLAGSGPSPLVQGLSQALGQTSDRLAAVLAAQH